jgi:hypothetical protein
MRTRIAPRTMLVLIECLTIVLIGAMSALSTSVPAGAGQSILLPTSIPSGCGSGDNTSALEGFLATVPANATVMFPKDGCFIVNGTLLVQGTTGLTIDGNGSTLEQTVSPATAAPIVELWDDTNLTITTMNVIGAYNGTNGGERYEGDYGYELEGDNGVNLNHDATSDIQGDFMYLSPPYDLSNITDSLNTNIDVTDSTFTNAGYHGLTVESVGCLTLAACNGLTVSNDTFNGIGTDAMDFEYDDYSTPFNANGTPFWAAQDYVTIEDNTWSNWGNDWFASVQGQTPGVQEQHLTLTGNRLAGNGPVFEVVGTNRAATTEPHTNDYWTITNNAFQPGYYVAPYRGGDSVAAQLYDISDLTMTGNTFPGCTGLYESPQPVATCGAPSEYLMDLDVITYGTIENNNFSGMQGMVLPQSYPTYITDVTECDNKYGANAAQLDAPCAPPTTTVVLPANNARLSGTQYLDASASSGASGVVYELSGGGLSDDVVATGGENLYGWPAKWNTAAVPDGTYTLQSVASYAGGVTGTSPPVTVMIINQSRQDDRGRFRTPGGRPKWGGASL